MATVDVDQSSASQKCLWDTGFFKLSIRQQATASEMRKTLRSCANLLGPFLADVRDDGVRVKFSKTDVAAVESHLIESLKGKDPHPTLRLLKSAVLRLVQKSQRDIPTPTRIDRLTADPNLLPKNLSEVQRRVAVWTEAEKLWLDHNSGFLPPENGGFTVTWEMVIASAALRGGLLSVRRAVALARALADPHKHFGRSPIRGYADLVIPAGSEDEEVVRWYPDGRLLLLISRVSPEKVQQALAQCLRPKVPASTRDRGIAQLILKGIVAELNRQGVDPGLLPRSLSDFVGTVAQTLRKELPSLLVDYATGQVRGPSLLPGSIGRINNDPAVYVPSNSGKTKSPEVEGPDRKKAYAKDARSKEPEWMRRLRSAFHLSDDKKTVKALNGVKRSKDSTPCAIQLCTLAKKLLTGLPYGGSGRQWAYGSVRCCILTVARRFAIQMKDKDPAGSDKVVLEGLYSQTVDEAAEDSHGVQETVAWALRQYHRHIWNVYEAPAIDEAEVLRVAPGSDCADAHVVSIDEIIKSLEYIEISRNRKWKKLYRTVARGLIVMDFFGGLRRAEGLGLMPTDLSPGPFGHLLVRDNEIRTLKTENANRCIPLGVLAHPFSELLEPVADLFREAKRIGTDLSCGMSDDVIVPIVHKALQTVTGLKNCHGHTLRHSAAHYAFIRLMLADLNQKDLFPHLPITTAWLRCSPDLRALLLHNGQSMNNDCAWVVATIMGHSNPGRVTFRHYAHCLDILLAKFLSEHTNLGAPATREELRALSYLPRATAYEHLSATADQDKGQNTNPASFDRQVDNGRHLEPGYEFALRVYSDRLKLKSNSRVEPVELPDKCFWPKDTYDLLWMSWELSLKESKLATIFGLEELEVGEILSRARSVMRIRNYQASPGSPAINETVAEDTEVELARALRQPKMNWTSKCLQVWADGIQNYCVSSKTAANTIDYILRNMLQGNIQIVFAGIPKPEMMKACLHVFEAIGFRRDDLFATSCDGTKRAVPTRGWLQDRGISWRIAAKNEHSPGRLLQTPAPWVVIGPKTPEDGGLSLRHQSEAISFLFRMAAIRFN
jgi:hypothetical protein